VLVEVIHHVTHIVRLFGAETPEKGLVEPVIAAQPLVFPFQTVMMAFHRLDIAAEQLVCRIHDNQRKQRGDLVAVPAMRRKPFGLQISVD